MRLRVIAALAAFSLSSGVAFASPGATGASVGAKVTGGVVAAGGAVGAVAAVSNLFRGSTKREAMAVSHAPEISTSGAAAGLILLAGGMLIVRGRRSEGCAE